MSLIIKGPLKSISYPSLNSQVPEGIKLRNGHVVKIPEFGMMFLLTVMKEDKLNTLESPPI